MIFFSFEKQTLSFEGGYRGKRALRSIELFDPKRPEKVHSIIIPFIRQFAILLSKRILEYMDEMCTQYQCHFKEEPFVCYRAIDLHPKLYIC